MKISSFFKILNKKIEKYDKMASNPFMSSPAFVLVWIDEPEKDWFSIEDEKT